MLCLNNILELKVQPFEKKLEHIKDKVVISLLLFTTFHIKQCTTIQEERNTIRAFSWQVQNKTQKIFKTNNFSLDFFPSENFSHLLFSQRFYKHIII